MFSNILLTWFDKEMRNRGYQLTPLADDRVVTCKSAAEARAALAIATKVLKGHFERVLANAAHIKNVPGQKSDANDAAWIAELLAHGLIRSGFISPRLIQDVRALTRTRKQLVREIAQHFGRPLGADSHKPPSPVGAASATQRRAITEELGADFFERRDTHKTLARLVWRIAQLVTSKSGWRPSLTPRAQPDILLCAKVCFFLIVLWNDRATGKRKAEPAMQLAGGVGDWRRIALLAGGAGIFDSDRKLSGDFLAKRSAQGRKVYVAAQKRLYTWKPARDVQGDRGPH